MSGKDSTLAVDDTPDPDHSMALLTEQEREAIAAGDVSAKDVEALKTIAAQVPPVVNGSAAEVDEEADDDANADGDDAAGDEDAVAGADDTAGAAAEAAKPAADAPAEVAADDDVDDGPEPIAPVFTLPETFDADVASNKAEIDALKARRKAGDLEDDEYDAELEKLTDRRDELKGLKMQADISLRTAEQAERARRIGVAKTVCKAALKDGLDYDGDPVAFAVLSTNMAKLDQDPKTANKSFDWKMAKADTLTRERLGVAGAKQGAAAAVAKAAAAAPQPSPKQIIAAAAAARRPSLEKAPKTVAHLPGGEGPGDMGSPFTDIDKLRGAEQEAAIAALKPAERARFMRMQ